MLRHSPAAALFAVVSPLAAAAVLGEVLLSAPGYAAPEQTSHKAPAPVVPSTAAPLAAAKAPSRPADAPQTTEAPRRQVRVIYVGPITAR